MSLLKIENLSVQFGKRQGGALRAVDNLSFEIMPGETVAIVGESGSGKSVTAMSIMRLLETPPATLSGQIYFEGRDLLQLSEQEMQKVRGARIGMIFQEPMTSLNPVHYAGAQVSEAVRLHEDVSRSEADRRALDLLRLVGIPDPERRWHEYPHRLSGGMRQRVMIATALACNPSLLIADEPTTALDVTVQAQILKMMRDLQERSKSAIALITHDFGVVAEMANRVLIMYAGRVVEQGGAGDIFRNPSHPYTRGLLAAVPKLGSTANAGGKARLNEIPGSVPNLRERLEGCSFAPRCAHAKDICRAVRPEHVKITDGHEAACHFAGELSA